MPKKEKKVEYNQMDSDDLFRHLDKNKQELFKLRFRSASGAVKNVMQIRLLRREIARIQTFINQKRRQAV